MGHYPSQLEGWAETDKGVRVFVRPIKWSDGPKLKAFFYTLSPETVYHRFLTPIKEVSDEQVRPFVEIDYDRHMALAALNEPDGDILGVARYFRTSDQEADIAVVVTDSWQGRGIGTLLLKRLCDWGRSEGIRVFNSTVDPQNIRLLEFARTLGFEARPKYEDGVIRLVCTIGD